MTTANGSIPLSVIIPSYNRAAMVSECFRSMLA
jgi:hypothetical protein